MVKPLKSKAKNYLKTRGFYKELLREKNSLEDTNRKLKKKIKEDSGVTEYPWFAKPGHFYSPLFDADDQDIRHLVDLWHPKGKEVDLPGIAIDKKAQLALLEDLAKYSE